ncbi:Fic family protein [Candidatus Saccharibacteria bacterium]|nr:Fic family protein [Candidatus Saccharibacteria bacterium]
MILKDKYNLTREENVFVAKKYLKDSVYRSAFLEGMAVTFPQTEAILENATVNNVSAKDVAKVIELRDAWEYLLANLDVSLDLKYLEDLHEIIAREDVPWDRLGKLRTDNVRISGTNYIPKVPNPETASLKINEILESDNSDTEKAITMLLYLMRAQLFLDGNKRIATFACNKILVSTGHGIFSLPPELKEEFAEKLIHFYETDDMDELKTFVYDNCLSGL